MKSLRIVALLGAVLVGISANVRAQTPPSSVLVHPSVTLPQGAFDQRVAPAPIFPAEGKFRSALDGTNWQAIRVRNVRPSLLAYWLDPRNNALPAFVNVPWTYSAKPAAQSSLTTTTPKNAFDLPDGVGRLLPVDDANLLFVAGGTDAEIGQIQELVGSLDHPQRQVEIEAQAVSLPIVEVAQFLQSDFDAPFQGASQTKLARADFQQRLDELAKAGTAKVLSTGPQKIANNNGLAVSLLSGPIDNTGANQRKRPTAPTNGSDTIITLTSTINGDNTISVLVRATSILGNSDQPLLQAIVNLRDGDTVALSSSSLSSSVFPRKIPMLNDIPLINSPTPSSFSELNQIPIIGRLFRSKTAEEQREPMIFITARILDNGEK